MNRVTKRTWIMGLFLAVLLGGMMFFLWEYVTQAGEWVTFPGSPHVYNNANIGCGTVTDRSGNVLLDITEERTYSSDETTRKSTLHWLGDRKGYISASAVSHYAWKMAGFDLVSGVYDSSGEGGEMNLTLSARVQNAALDAMDGRKGTVGVYNYKTGEILCALTTPTYDPDNVPDIASDTSGQYDGVYLNRFFSGTFPPGSTFKLVTTAAAIEQKKDLSEFRYSCTGKLQVGDDVITCPYAHGQNMDIDQCLACSCNGAYATLAMELGGNTLHKYTKQAGLLDSHKVCGINTAKGSFEVEPDGSAHLGWSGVGQDKDLANPCALMTLMGGIASEGEAVVPKLVAKESVTGTALPAAFPDGKETYSVFSQSTCQRLKAMMRNNVTSQYGQSQFGDLAVCAKSGTAEVGSGEPHAWFTGFIDDPDHPLAFVVLVENGGGGAKVAGSIAAKVLLQATAE